MKTFRRSAFLLATLFLGIAGAKAEPGRSVVPMTLTQADYGGGRIYLPMRFGNMMGAMRLDTGASTTRVALAPWNKDLAVLGQSDSTGASGRTVRCDDVEAKNVEIKASQGSSIARAKYEVARCAANDGDDLLGLDFFRGARFSLDFTRREMTFFGDAPARATPFRLLGPDQKLVGVAFKIGNATTVGLFDTGAEVSAVDQQFVDRHKNLFTPVKRKGKASEAGGAAFSSKIYKIKALDLGEGRVLKGVYALAYDFGVLGEALGPQTPFILGFNFISRLNWTLDFTQAKAPVWDARAK
ncbi:retropepsin-like aspartic protease [Methylocystis sp. JAN1]|uniref:retropepsin-like aspartic protease n=1 Tax=Methylocystis sp. JAN1 TaxID=3397211 RepID=UPI003FA26797